MELHYSELENDIRLIRLNGALDIGGVGEIETKFSAYCSGNRTRVIVDLSGVEFLASIGIRMLMLNAKSISSRGGRMVLLNPTAEVSHILEVSGIPAVIPVSDTLEDAKASLLPA